MRLAPIAARLAAQAPLLAQVSSALADPPPASYPAAWVLPLAEQIDEQALSGSARVCEQRFGVQLMVRHAARADAGGPAADALEDVREQVLAALVGWQPPGAAAPIRQVAGRLLRYEDGLAVWRDEFITQSIR